MPKNSTNTYPSLIGLAGLPRSGKDTLADFLIKVGYFGVSIGDIVREESRKRHKNDSEPISIINMTETANWLRASNGADFALKIALEKFEKIKENYKGLVLYSIRTPVEADFIKANGGLLVWLEVSDNIRYERSLEYLREGELPIPKKEFLRREALQWQPQADIDPTIQMNISYVKERADVAIDNSAEMGTFLAEAKDKLGL